MCRRRSTFGKPQLSGLPYPAQCCMGRNAVSSIRYSVSAARYDIRVTRVAVNNRERVERGRVGNGRYCIIKSAVIGQDFGFGRIDSPAPRKLLKYSH